VLKANEAISISLLLAEDRPNVFRPRLVFCFNNLSLHLLECGCPEEALQANDEALKLYRILATDSPTPFHSNIAVTLQTL
jgi:hypothetical protein